jgi:acetyl-CoA acetyltransferase
VVIVSALRSPITRARKGGLNNTPADDLLATLLKATVVGLPTFTHAHDSRLQSKHSSSDDTQYVPCNQSGTPRE